MDSTDVNKRIGAPSPMFLSRLAGCLYLLIIFGGLFAPFAVAPSGMMLGDAALPSLAKITTSRALYALGGIAQLLVYTCDIAVAVLFYELLKAVRPMLSLAAAFLRLAFAIIASVNMILHFAPLIILSGGDYLAPFSPSELRALAMGALRLRTVGFDVALVFFGFHWLIAGYLFFRSRFIPRIIGIALAVGGAGYVANIIVMAVPRDIASRFFPYVLLPAGLAEVVLAIWLATVGIKLRTPESMEPAGSILEVK